MNTLMDVPYEKLALPDMSAQRAQSRRREGQSPTGESVLQDANDAAGVLTLAGMWECLRVARVLEPDEKYLVESAQTPPVGNTQEPSSGGAKPKAPRKPHYIRLLESDNALVFQSACCLPLKIVAAAIDGVSASGRVLFSAHSEAGGGKLLYEFQGKGDELIIDLQRGEKGARLQRIIFRNKKKTPGSVAPQGLSVA